MFANYVANFVSMSNVRATVLDIAISLKSKTANNIQHDYNSHLGIKRIAITLKVRVCQLHLLSGNNTSLSLRQISRNIGVLT